MKALGHYTIATVLIVAVLGGALWPFLDGPGRVSLAVAAALVVPVQLVSFFAVAGAIGDQNRFIVRWGLGFLARMAIVGAVGLLLPRLGSLDGAVLLLSICGLFFVLLLMEPAFFRGKATARFAQ
jgi:hypothetical protein